MKCFNEENCQVINFPNKKAKRSYFIKILSFYRFTQLYTIDGFDANCIVKELPVML